MTNRYDLMTQWLSQHISNCSVGEHFGDASFRSYWRVTGLDKNFVVMDAPPEKEDCVPFIAVDLAFKACDLHVPTIHAQNLNDGFLLLDDFGDDIFYRIINQDNVNTLYTKAINDIHKIQQCERFDDGAMPHFDDKWMGEELDNFSEWFVEKTLQLKLSSAQKAIITDCYQRLCEEILAQPQHCIHRDYHSKNLMHLDDGNVGILDFQDAMLGSIVYDLVSLIRDCYVDWPLEQVYAWTDNFQKALEEQGKIHNINQETFHRWLDVTGMQRHLKAIFIFARKNLRDNDSSYLMYISRTLNYIKYVCHKYPEYHPFEKVFMQYIYPNWKHS